MAIFDGETASRPTMPPPGFGDCFLLRIDYDDASARHILIDFGSTGLPKDDPTVNMARVAEDIAESCGG